MKVLVTGGAGFIGSNIVRFLVERRYKVTVLDNLSSGYKINLNALSGINFIKADVRDAKLVVKAAKGSRVIFHLAASVGNIRSINNPRLDAQVNVLGTLNVLEAARYQGIKKVVFSSSAGIFGELKTIPIREDHPVEPCSPYGVSKLAAEKLCLAYAKLYKMECICLRYFNVYGINQRYDAYGNVIPIFAYQMLRNRTLTIFGDGRQTRDFVNVRDVVQANYKAAISSAVVGAFNIASGTRISINGLVKLMSHVSGCEPKIKYGAPRTGDVRDSLADISAAKKAFGYKPIIEMEQGLCEYFIWLKSQMRNAKNR